MARLLLLACLAGPAAGNLLSGILGGGTGNSGTGGAGGLLSSLTGGGTGGAGGLLSSFTGGGSGGTGGLLSSFTGGGSGGGLLKSFTGGGSGGGGLLSGLGGSGGGGLLKNFFGGGAVTEPPVSSFSERPFWEQSKESTRRPSSLEETSGEEYPDWELGEDWDAEAKTTKKPTTEDPRFVLSRSDEDKEESSWEWDQRSTAKETSKTTTRSTTTEPTTTHRTTTERPSTERTTRSTTTTQAPAVARSRRCELELQKTEDCFASKQGRNDSLALSGSLRKCLRSAGGCRPLFNLFRLQRCLAPRLQRIFAPELQTCSNKAGYDINFSFLEVLEASSAPFEALVTSPNRAALRKACPALGAQRLDGLQRCMTKERLQKPHSCVKDFDSRCVKEEVSSLERNRDAVCECVSLGLSERNIRSASIAVSRCAKSLDLNPALLGRGDRRVRFREAFQKGWDNFCNEGSFAGEPTLLMLL